MDIMGMMKKAQTIQKKLQETQNELANEEITVEVQNGAVKVTLDGKAQSNFLKKQSMLKIQTQLMKIQLKC